MPVSYPSFLLWDKAKSTGSAGVSFFFLEGVRRRFRFSFKEAESRALRWASLSVSFSCFVAINQVGFC